MVNGSPSDSSSPDSARENDVRRSPRLGEHVARQIAKAIELGDHVEGARLPTEKDLAAKFGVSRPVVREALSNLRDQGLVVSRRGSGSYVARREAGAQATTGAAFSPITNLAEVRRCFQFRETIEGDAAFHAALNHTPETL